jgi:hypothetical protein
MGKGSSLLPFVWTVVESSGLGLQCIHSCSLPWQPHPTGVRLESTSLNCQKSIYQYTV